MLGSLLEIETTLARVPFLKELKRALGSIMVSVGIFDKYRAPGEKTQEVPRPQDSAG